MDRFTLLAPGDEAALDAFLALHPATSLFLRSNLRRAGLADDGQRFGGRYGACLDGDGAIQGVVAHAWNGNLLIQAPPDMAAEIALWLAGKGDRPVRGVIGPLPAVRAVQTALPDHKAGKDSAEDLFDLDLATLRIPPTLASGALAWRRSIEADLPLLTGWRRAYAVEALGERDDAVLATRAADDIATWHGHGDIFVLTDANGTPLSMATHNARIPDTVQIGGVWTPAALRGRGYARAAVAGALLAARDDGARTAVLFTGKENEPARRAYLSLGFRIIGDYGIVLFG